ncbi:RloB family protein [Polynucleobacter sp. P1-05-14]|uniref:RloB family protein n=1 Tax=Polynucleobacter sp. P1-05-14 TaxID=1819732 RepID=UPI001C0B5B7B|nr:RloB family protein [Polynucleobacter sp. P1-05-14]MBU3548103.1 RloB domain-containing protein [Polynucleobacter sp. P1-05-14]
MTSRRLSVLRGERSFTRKAGNTPPKEVTLIVCEGETETKYLKAICQSLRLATATIYVCDNGTDSAPVNLVNKAEQLNLTNDGYDHIYCVFDKDIHESFDRAREKIRSLSRRTRKPLPIKEAVSIPSFELWVLLHFEQTDRSFGTSAEVVRYISNQNHIRAYKKADDLICQELITRLETAIKNAGWLERRGHTSNENPMTNVHKLVQHIKEIAIKQSQN